MKVKDPYSNHGVTTEAWLHRVSKKWAYQVRKLRFQEIRKAHFLEMRKVHFLEMRLAQFPASAVMKNSHAGGLAPVAGFLARLTRRAWISYGRYGNRISRNCAWRSSRRDEELPRLYVERALCPIDPLKVLQTESQ